MTNKMNEQKDRNELSERSELGNPNFVRKEKAGIFSSLATTLTQYLVDKGLGQSIVERRVERAKVDSLVSRPKPEHAMFKSPSGEILPRSTVTADSYIRWSSSLHISPAQTNIDYEIPSFINADFPLLPHFAFGSPVFSCFPVESMDPKVVNFLQALPANLQSDNFDVRINQPPFVHVHLNSASEVERLNQVIFRRLLNAGFLSMETTRKMQTYVMNRTLRDDELVTKPFVVPIGLLIHGTHTYEVRSLVPFEGELVSKAYEEAWKAHKFDYRYVEPNCYSANPLAIFVGYPLVKGYDLQMIKELNPFDFAAFETAVLVSSYVYNMMKQYTINMEKIPLYSKGQSSNPGMTTVNRQLRYSLSIKRSGTVVFPRTDIWSLDVYYYTQGTDDIPLTSLSCGRLYQSMLMNMGARMGNFAEQVGLEITIAVRVHLGMPL